MEDIELLREYASHRCEQAFADLVHRHVNLVYSTALRLVRETHLAEDVTQMVFIKLARKAGALREGIILTGWLYRTTQFIAQTALRSDWRRRQRERLTMQFIEIHGESESIWNEVAPVLEAALANLRQADQDAVLLRFFAGKSLRDVGQALGISDDAAQKRVNRALDKLRDYFARRGIAVSSASIAPAIAAHAVQAAPAGLASSLVTASLTGATGGFTTLNMCKALFLAKLKTAQTGLAACLLLFAGLGLVALPAANQTKTVPSTDPNANAAYVLSGTVRTPDGKPLAGALVRAATPQHYVRLYQTTNAVSYAGTNSARTNVSSGNPSSVAKAPPPPAPVTNSAADGTFTLTLPEPPKDGLAAVVVTSDAGYALVTAGELTVNSNVTVQAWARLEGVLRVGKNVASDQTVNIGIWGATELFDWNLVQHAASTKTDANGRFVFPRIAPVDVWLTRTVMVRPNDGRQSGHHFVRVQPGDHIIVQLGGIGRTVSGRVSLENPLVFYGSMWANAAPGIRHPRNWKDWSREEQRTYERAWRNSAESDPFKDTVRNYEFPVRPDGTFKVDDVLPGTYRMQVRADEPRPDGKGSRHAAAVEVTVVVPDLFPGERDEPIDVGELVPRSPQNR